MPTDTDTVTSIRNAIAQYEHWYHRIEVYPGIVTPGINDTEANLGIFDRLGLPQDATGLRVLDIGCADGYFSFLMEKRGASEVIALDYRKSTESGFAIASQILSSNVKYVVDNVYNLTPEKYGTFDLVLFFGVLYHLRNPLLALDRLRSIVNTGGMVFIETHLIDNAILLPDGTVQPLQSVAPTLVEVPLWQFYGRDSLNKDATNKWAPNMTGLKQAVEEAQFKVLDSKIYGSRGSLKAEAIADQNLEYFRLLDSGTTGF